MMNDGDGAVKKLLTHSLAGFLCHSTAFMYSLHQRPVKCWNYTKYTDFTILCAPDPTPIPP